MPAMRSGMSSGRRGYFTAGRDEISLSGWLADRTGARFVITVSISGVALAGFFVGLSQTFLMIVVSLALMGLTGGGYHPAAAPLISMTVKSKKLGRAR